MIIDADQHVTEPPDVFVDRMSVKKWGDRVPHVAWDEKSGKEAWFVGDTRLIEACAAAAYGWPGVYPSCPPTFADAHPATYDAKARLEMMDSTGIWAAALYPNLAGAFGLFGKLNEPELLLETVRAYNDWLVDWTSVDRERFILLGLIPYWDVVAAEAEIERLAGNGFQGVVTTGVPQAHGQPFFADPHWDRLWAAAQSHELSINFHVADGNSDMGTLMAPKRQVLEGAEANNVRESTGAFLNNALHMNDLLISGVLPRYPDLKFGIIESGIGWVQFVLESADYHYTKSQMWKSRPMFTMLPSEYFRRQLYVSYWFEKLESWHLENIGRGHILFETDFPHVTCLEDGQVGEAIDRGLSGLTEELRDEITWKNAADLYRVPFPRADWVGRQRANAAH
jgi:predicted TIM-barrel fold metal-dependent hydrolase